MRNTSNGKIGKVYFDYISSQSLSHVKINNFRVVKRETGLNFPSIKSTSIHFSFPTILGSKSI